MTWKGVGGALMTVLPAMTYTLKARSGRLGFPQGSCKLSRWLPLRPLCTPLTRRARRSTTIAPALPP